MNDEMLMFTKYNDTAFVSDDSLFKLSGSFEITEILTVSLPHLQINL